MAAYLVVSVVTGLFCAAVSYFGFGVGLLATALWYVVGCWAGFAACVAAFLLDWNQAQTTNPSVAGTTGRSLGSGSGRRAPRGEPAERRPGLAN